jgi:hypothetical protein
VAETAAIKYRAFLSYGHADTAWARWLHARRLRHPQGPRRPRPALGLVPKALRPVFRDREDFSGGHSLTDATIAAIDTSAALIVLCSPIAADRPVSNEEVRLFRARHPDRPVIPISYKWRRIKIFQAALDCCRSCPATNTVRRT